MYLFPVCFIKAKDHHSYLPWQVASDMAEERADVHMEQMYLFIVTRMEKMHICIFSDRYEATVSRESNKSDLGSICEMIHITTTHITGRSAYCPLTFPVFIVAFSLARSLPFSLCVSLCPSVFTQ